MSDAPRELPRAEMRRRARQQAQVSALSWLLLGLALGVAGALYYTWMIDPVVYFNVSPARLSDDDQAEYILLVSQSFAATGDWEQARRRLAALEDRRLERTVSDLLERQLREGRPAPVVQNLAKLAAELGIAGTAIDLFAPTPAGLVTRDAVALAGGATPTPAATASPTLPPTATPSPTPSATPAPQATATRPPVYRLVAQDRVCDSATPAPRIELVVVDAEGAPLPGIEAVVRWETGADHFFTGFKPRRGLGYGDFTMAPETTYSLVLVDGSPQVPGLRVEDCPSASGGLPGGWRLTFQHTTLRQATAVPTAAPGN